MPLSPEVWPLPRPPARVAWTERTGCGAARAGLPAELVAVRPILDEEGPRNLAGAHRRAEDRDRLVPGLSPVIREPTGSPARPSSDRGTPQADVNASGDYAAHGTSMTKATVDTWPPRWNWTHALAARARRSGANEISGPRTFSLGGRGSPRSDRPARSAGARSPRGRARVGDRCARPGVLRIGTSASRVARPQLRGVDTHADAVGRPRDEINRRHGCAGTPSPVVNTCWNICGVAPPQELRDGHVGSRPREPPSSMNTPSAAEQDDRA